MGRLDGKVAMITGCGGEVGFGRAIAGRLAAEGADLVLTDIAPAGTKVVPTKPATGWGGLDAVAAEVRQAGRRAITALVDVRSAPQIERAVAEALNAFGRIDILVNNAAAPPGPERVPVVDLPEEVWSLLMDVNLKGSFLCAKAVAATMLRAQVRGRIINMGSDCGRRGLANMAAYCASKFGVIGFTQALAHELGPSNVTVNAVCPGEVDTAMWREHLLPALSAMRGGDIEAAWQGFISERVPLGRPQTIEDIGEAVVFLCRAENITGEALNVTGGSELR